QLRGGGDMTSGSEIAFSSAEALAELYRRKALSPVEAAEILFARIEALQPKLNAFCIIDRDGALASARASEQRWRQGAPLSALDGVPVTIKDLVLMRGFPTLRGSKLIDPAQDWSEDGPAVARLREAGAVILGKTTTPEFGWKAIGDSPLTGITRNPWNLERTPGGSSAGAAAACAAGIAPLHVGSDGGGAAIRVARCLGRGGPRNLPVAARRAADDLGRRRGAGAGRLPGRAAPSVRPRPGRNGGPRRPNRLGRVSRGRHGAHRSRHPHGRIPRALRFAADPDDAGAGLAGRPGSERSLGRGAMARLVAVQLPLQHDAPAGRLGV